MTGYNPDGLPAHLTDFHQQSPIQVVTGPSVD